MRVLLYVGIVFVAIVGFSQQRDTFLLPNVELNSSVIHSENKIDESASGYSITLSDSVLRDQNAVSVTDFVKLVPSLYVKNYGGIGGLKTISVRGLGSQHTGIWLNQNLITDQKTGQVDLSIFSPRTITKMQFAIASMPGYLPTAKSHIYNSTLAFEESPVTRLGQDSTRIVLGTSIGSFSTYQPYVSYIQKLKDGVALSVDYEMLSTQGVYDYAYQNGQKEISGKREHSALTRHVAKLNYENKNAKAQIFGWFKYQNQELPGVVVLNNPFSDATTKGVELVLNGKKEWQKGSYTVKLRGGGYTSKSNYKDPNYLNSEGGLNTDFNEFGSNISLGVARNIKFWDVYIVSDLEQGQFTSNSIESAVNRYANYTAIGTSFDNNKWRVEGNMVHSFIYDDGRSENTSVWNGMFGASYKAYQNSNSNIYLKANYKSSFRMPSFNDLYYNNIGNLDLKPESTQQLNLGITGVIQTKSTIFNQFVLMMNGFYGHVDNKIIAVPTQNLSVWSMQNIALVHNSGLDASIDFQSTKFKGFQFGGSYVYTLQFVLDYSDKADNYYKDQIRYTPYNLMNGTVWGSYDKFKVIWNTQFIGHQFYLPENITPNLIDGVVLNDVTAVYEFKKWLELKLSARNVFDSQYELVKGFPMMGRNFWLTALVTI